MFTLSPLPSRFGTPTSFSDHICIDGLTLHRAGVSAVAPNGEAFVGAAVSGAATGLLRAEYELLERAATLDAIGSAAGTLPLLDASEQVVGSISGDQVFPTSDRPDQWRYARSNGIALHQSWGVACLRAKQELAERDRVLRSWFEQKGPRRLDWEPAASLRRINGYSWRAYDFETSQGWSQDIAVVGIVGMPVSSAHPLALGFAGRSNPTEAITAALTEALQQLAFLWDEAIPTEAPEPSPTALFHLEYFQYPEHRHMLSKWLSSAAPGPSKMHPREPASTAYVDLTPSWLPNGMRVAKAICRDARPLMFGRPPMDALRPELLIHPVA